MNYLHDENYDGVVLKIPSWFIRMNKLEGFISACKEELEKCNLSSQFPDHLMNINELEGWVTKSEYTKNKKEEAKRRVEILKERQRMIYAHEMYELTWVKENVYIDLHNNYIYINGIEYGEENVFTKSGVRAEFIKAIKSELRTISDIKNFVEKNKHAHELSHLIEGLTDDTISMDFSIFLCSTGWDQLGLGFNVLNVRHEWTKGRKNMLCRERKLLTFEDGTYGIDSLSGVIRLDGFIRKGMYLVNTNHP